MSDLEQLLAAAWGRMQPYIEKQEDGCWVWKGGKSGSYGRVAFGPRSERVHRVAWAVANGKWPHGMHVHHECRNRVCVNPAHLQALDAGAHSLISSSEDFPEETHYSRVLKARTHCPRGHAYTPQNTYVNAKGYRACRACGREHVARKRARLDVLGKDTA